MCLLITNISFFLSLFINIYLFLAVLCLCCCKGFFSNCREWGYSLGTEHGLLVVAASPVAEHRLQVAGASVVAVMGSYEVQLVGSRAQ